MFKSTGQFDISENPNYLNRKMFLDGPVTLQRFDVVKYPKIQMYEKIARGYFWVPEEIDLNKDKQDAQNASESVMHTFTSNILRQTTLDSLQGKTPIQIFGPCCSLPELEALFNAWSFFETNIHSNSYSHIIRNIYSDPSAVFDNVHNIQEIVNMAVNVGRYYSDLDYMNNRKAYGETIPKLNYKFAILMALHASYALEAIRFMVSFATSFAMMENKIFIGNGTIVSLILQDELLHADWTAWILNQLLIEDPDFITLTEQFKDEIYNLYDSVIQEEKEWADFLCKKGPIIGLNAKILKNFVDWTSKEALAKISITYKEESPKSHPIPWFMKHVNQETKQTALQELESTNYVIGVMSGELNTNELPNL